MAVILELRMLEAGEFQFKANLGYRTKCYIKNEWTANKQKQNKINQKIRQKRGKAERWSCENLFQEM